MTTPNDPYGQQYQQQRQYQQPPQGYQPGPGYPPQHGGPPPKRRHTGRNIFLGVLSAIVVIIIIAAVASSGTTPASHAPKAPVKPHVIAVFHGNGIQNTRRFTTPSAWVLRYSFNCAQFGGQAGNFAVTENGLGAVSVDRIGHRGHGETRGYSDAGRHYLEVDSECRWTMRVIS